MRTGKKLEMNFVTVELIFTLGRFSFTLFSLISSSRGNTEKITNAFILKSQNIKKETRKALFVNCYRQSIPSLFFIKAKEKTLKEKEAFFLARSTIFFAVFYLVGWRIQILIVGKGSFCDDNLCRICFGFRNGYFCVYFGNFSDMWHISEGAA